MVAATRFALGACVGLGAMYLGCQQPDVPAAKTQEPSELQSAPTLQISQAAADPELPTFYKRETERIEYFQRVLVRAMDDIDLTKGIVRTVTPGGVEKIEKVEPMFGYIRGGFVISHGNKNRMAGDSASTDDPHVIGFGAHGRPMTSANVRAYNTGRGETVAENIRAVIGKRIDEVNAGKEIKFFAGDHKAWVKPLFLTREECLPCHGGMKVGDVVGAIAYARPTVESDEAEARRKKARPHLPMVQPDPWPPELPEAIKPIHEAIKESLERSHATPGGSSPSNGILESAPSGVEVVHPGSDPRTVDTGGYAVISLGSGLTLDYKSVQARGTSHLDDRRVYSARRSFASRVEAEREGIATSTHGFGQDSWTIPIRLSKPECLSCH